MYQRQSFLPIFSNHSFFCLPESVGWYKDWPYQWVDRAEGEWETFSIHLIISGKGCVETDDDVITLEKGDSLLYFPNSGKNIIVVKMNRGIFVGFTFTVGLN